MRSRKLVRSVSGLMIVVGLCGTALFAASPQPAKSPWHTDLFKAHEQSLLSDKPLLIVFSSKSCLYCRKLEVATLADPVVDKYVRQEFIPVKLDLNRDARVAKILEIKAVPCTIVLTPEADLVGKITGFLEAGRYHLQLQKARKFQDEIRKARQTAQSESP